MNRQHVAPGLLSRRRFVQGAGVAGLGLLAGCGWLAVQAPAPPRLFQIGLLSGGSAAANAARLEAFQQGLHERGYVEGTNVALQVRWAEGQLERLPELAAELVGTHPDVLVVAGDGAIRSAQQASSTIPIVMAISADPVRLGFITSLARPGGNITGLSTLTRELAGKHLEFLKAINPGGSRVAFLWDPANPGAEVSLSEMLVAAQQLGVQLDPLEMRSPDDFDSAFEAAARQGAEMLIVTAGGLTSSYPSRIVDLAARSGLPAMYTEASFTRAGGLMSYGTRNTEHYRRAAYFVDRILKGAKPADLPVEQPREFEFVINLQTAQALGLTIPQHVLLQATEVIQ